jgi:hypothetical protein
MKDLAALDQYRERSARVVWMFGSYGDSTCGAFNVFVPRSNVTVLVMASCGLGWDHVSVSLPNRCPNWHEMEFIKRMFFRDDETVMQLHVPPTDHISFADNCLHLWRPQRVSIPRPPDELVGAPAAMRRVSTR